MIVIKITGLISLIVRNVYYSATRITPVHMDRHLKRPLQKRLQQLTNPSPRRAEHALKD